MRKQKNFDNECWKTEIKIRRRNQMVSRLKEERFKISMIGILKEEVRGDKGNKQRNND